MDSTNEEVQYDADYFQFDIEADLDVLERCEQEWLTDYRVEEY